MIDGINIARRNKYKLETSLKNNSSPSLKERLIDHGATFEMIQILDIYKLALFTLF